MGRQNLDKLRSRLQVILGNRGFSADELTDWVNDGYFDVAEAQDFKELWCTTTIDLTQGTSAYGLPDDLVGIKTIKIDGEGRVLQIHPEEFYLKDMTAEEGVPDLWTTDDNALRLYPVPDDSYTLRMLYRRHPTALENDNDVTILTPTWDRAVLLMSAHHAALDLGENQNATDWLRRAMSYIRSRFTQFDIDPESPTERGLNIARSRSDLKGLET